MATTQPEFPFEVFEEEMVNPLKGVELSEMELFIASLLLAATSAKPIKMAGIIEAVENARGVTLTNRQVRIIMRSLRRNHAFPICTRKGSPAGYYWGRSEKELEEFAGVWMAQYKDEAQTLHIMLKTNYPRLAGQMRLALEE